MKRRFMAILTLLLMVVLLFNLTACSNEPAAQPPKESNEQPSESKSSPTYTFKLGHNYSMEDTLSKKVVMFADEVFEKTNGDVKFEIYEGGQLGTTIDHIQGVANGYIDVGCEAINTYDVIDPLADIESYPFLFDSPEQAVAFINSDLSKELWDEICADTFEIFGASYRGARMLQTTKPVRNISDLQGLKLRTASMPILHRPWVILGAAPTTMDFTEIYTGLQQGTIEGQENPLGASYTSGFAEVEDYVMNTYHVFGIQAFYFNKDKFDQLPDNYKEIIIEAGENAAAWRNEQELNLEEQYIQNFKDLGAEFIEIEDLDDWKKALEEPLREEFPHLQEWFNKIKEFNSSN